MTMTTAIDIGRPITIGAEAYISFEYGNTSGGVPGT